MDSADWGSIPDWVEAVATSIAFLVAALAFSREVRLHHDRDEEDAWVRARDIVLEVEVNAGQRATPSGPEAFARSTVTVANQGVRDVEDVRLTVVPPAGGANVSLLGGLSPGQRESRSLSAIWDPSELAIPSRYGAQVEWIDRRGRRWEREYPKGTLRRLPSRKPYTD